MILSLNFHDKTLVIINSNWIQYILDFAKFPFMNCHEVVSSFDRRDPNCAQGPVELERGNHI